MTIDLFEKGIIQTLIQYAIRVGLALLVILIGRYLAHKVRGAVVKLLSRPEIEKALGPAAQRIIRQLAYFGVLFFTVIAALIVVGVPAAVVLSISGTVIILLGIALRESLSNFVATITIIFFGTYHLGEDIETHGKSGAVQEIQVFNTVLLTGDKTLITLPNGEILKSGVTNLSRLGIRRADVEFLVEYGQDMARIERIALDTLAREPRALADPPPYVAVNQLGLNGVTMQARAVVRYADYDRFMRDARRLIKNALEAEGIHLATPHQSIQVRNDQAAVENGNLSFDNKEIAG